jgi:hydrogenase maturation protease
VLGLGNILLRDEGVGVRVVETLQRAELPGAAECFDGGTAGLDLIDVIADRPLVIAVDAYDGDDRPGTVLRLTSEELAPPDAPLTSLHELGIGQVLTMARQMGVAPARVIVLAVRPGDVSPGLELSPEIAALVPELAALVETELRNAVPEPAPGQSRQR